METSLLFDAKNKSWTEEGAPILHEPFYNGCIVPLNDEHTKFLLIGGDTATALSTRRTAVYDWTLDEWRAVGDMHEGRRFIGQMCIRHTTPTGREVVIVIGGLQGGSTFLNSTEIYDIEDETWSYGPDLPHGMEGSLVAKTNGGIFLLGGRGLVGGSIQFLRTVLEMDQATLEWSVRSDLELPAVSARAAGITYNE